MLRPCRKCSTPYSFQKTLFHTIEPEVTKAYVTWVTMPGGGVCGLLRAKGFPWISPARHILVLVPSLTVSLFQHSREAAKMAPDLK